ncbi:major capsid protein P2 [Diaphorobacter nitroreducens]|uniref:major capsid protein P2 n=1 Tax=Diaphorobacter nitroreducens TaxID=164759 RepID=UPI0028976D67|nr:major capsid protein P2 [Diaphorobacter nitroreducens]
MNKQMIMDPFQNVVGTGVAIADMNKFLGTVLEKITLTLGGTFTKSMITKIELKANGKVIYETDGSKLDASNLYLGATSDVTILKIDFMDRKALTVNARQAGAIDLSVGSGIASLRLEVTISGATNPTLVGFCDVSPPSADPAEAGIRGLILRRHRAVYVVGAAGVFALPIPHLDPAGGGTNYRRVFIYSANMTALKTVREGVTEHELTKLQNEAAQKDNTRVPQANLVVFDPVQDGQLAGRTWDTRPAAGVRSAQFYGTFSAGETITIETEELLPYAAY